MSMTTVNPATGETVETFEPHDDAEVARRIAEAAEAAITLRDTTFAQRAEWMNATADIMEADVEQAARMLTLEMGKPIGQARAEVLKCAKNMRFYAEHAESFLADEPLADPSAVAASQAWTVWQPLGVVLAVMPWNYPLWQVIRFAAPALMAGNTGLLKHASNVPQSALYLDDDLREGRVPDRVVPHAADRLVRGRRGDLRRSRQGRHLDRIGTGGPVGGIHRRSGRSRRRCSNWAVPTRSS